MQSFRRINLHGLTGRDADADGNHQSDQCETDESADEQTVPFQGSAVPPTVQFGMGKVEIDNQRQRGDDEQQQPTFAEQAGKNHLVSGSMCLVQGYFTLALLGAEPEGTEQAEEDIYEQKCHAGEVVSHLIVLILLEALANILERTDVADEDVADAVLAFAVCFQTGNEILVVFGTDTDTKFKITSVPINLLHHAITVSCLLEVIVANSFQSRSLGAGLGGIAM